MTCTKLKFEGVRDFYYEKEWIFLSQVLQDFPFAALYLKVGITAPDILLCQIILYTYLGKLDKFYKIVAIQEVYLSNQILTI